MHGAFSCLFKNFVWRTYKASLTAQTPYNKTISEIPESTRTRWHEWFTLRFSPSNISLLQTGVAQLELVLAAFSLQLAWELLGDLLSG